jgi:hypothetical protein
MSGSSLRAYSFDGCARTEVVPRKLVSPFRPWMEGGLCCELALMCVPADEVLCNVARTERVMAENPNTF